MLCVVCVATACGVCVFRVCDAVRALCSLYVVCAASAAVCVACARVVHVWQVRV